MTAVPWMPLYVSDYLADTGHLSTLEHGAYLLLIMHYWQSGGLPEDDAKLARICRLSVREWEGIRDTLSDFFDDRWQHRRIEQEIETSRDRIKKRIAAGKAGASARYGNRIASASQTDGQLHTHTHTHQQKEKKINSGAKAPSRTTGKTIPPDWQPSESDTEWACKQGFPREFQDSQTEAMRFWAEANANRAIARKADWSKTWKGWCQREWQKWSRNGTGPPHRTRNGLADALDRAVEKAHRHDQGRDS